MIAVSTLAGLAQYCIGRPNLSLSALHIYTTSIVDNAKYILRSYREG